MMFRRPIVPPGGFVSFGQQTPATQALWAPATAKANGRMGGLRSARKRRKTKRAAVATRRPKRTRRGKARLVKGSPAARRHMAKLRRMRKRR